MNKTINTFLIAAAVILASLSFASCNSSGTPSQFPDDLATEFATFVSTSNDGTVFTFQRNEDSGLITLVANVKVDTEKLPEGSRVIIQYSPSGGQGIYQSGPITLYTLSPIINGSVGREPLATIESWISDRINMKSITRTGEYVNIWLEATSNADVKRFSLTADEATLADEVPVLYLVVTSDDTQLRTRQLYASLNISDVWDMATVKGVEIRYNDINDNRTVTFRKINLQPIEPGVDPAE